MKVRRNKIIEFSNDAGMLGLIITITSWVLWANMAKVFRVGLAKMRWANPYFIENTKETTKLVELFAVLLEWV